MRFLATVVTLLGLVNGVWALALNYRRWKHPERDTAARTRLRRGVTSVFLAVVAAALVLLAVVAVVSLVRISE